jgi:hypothetical protein
MDNKNVNSGRYTLVSKPVLKRHFKVKTDKLIKESNFLTDNEIAVAQKIKTIPHHETMYHVFLSYARLGLWEFYGDGHGEDNICISQPEVEEPKLLRFEYDVSPKVHLITEILRTRTAKLAVIGVMESYKFLLTSVLLLNESSVVHLNIDANNIYVLNMNVFQPVIYNFMHAFVFEEAENVLEYDVFDETLVLTGQIQKVAKVLDIDDNLCVTSPLEKYILYYLYKSTEPTLTLEMVETICGEYMENMKVSFLNLFPSEITRIHSESITFLIQYMYKPRQSICDEMIKHIYSWDNYGLASLYMFLLQSVILKFQLTTAYLEDIKKLLWSCLEVDPLKRRTTKDMVEKYNTLFCENINWEL